MCVCACEGDAEEISVIQCDTYIGVRQKFFLFAASPPAVGWLLQALDGWVLKLSMQSDRQAEGHKVHIVFITLHFRAGIGWDFTSGDPLCMHYFHLLEKTKQNDKCNNKAHHNQTRQITDFLFFFISTGESDVSP